LAVPCQDTKQRLLMMWAWHEKGNSHPGTPTRSRQDVGGFPLIWDKTLQSRDRLLRDCSWPTY